MKTILNFSLVFCLIYSSSSYATRELPLAVWGHTFEFLPLGEINNVESTCRGFRNEVNIHPRLQRMLIRELSHRNITTSDLTVILRGKRKHQILELLTREEIFKVLMDFDLSQEGLQNREEIRNKSLINLKTGLTIGIGAFVLLQLLIHYFPNDADLAGTAAFFKGLVGIVFSLTIMPTLTNGLISISEHIELKSYQGKLDRANKYRSLMNELPEGIDLQFNSDNPDVD